MPPLKIALYNYGTTMPIKEGQVSTGRMELEHIFVDPITVAMRQMCRTQNYDICEMAFTTYLAARAAGKLFTAIPVFLTRGFWHKAIFYNLNSGIKEPRDLEGRAVAVNRGYTVTTGLWARGVLASEYGVDLNKITWLPTDDEHVLEYKAPANVDYKYQGQDAAKLLASGEVDAAVGDLAFDTPDVKPLIKDLRETVFRSYLKSGIYPLNHTVVIQDSVLQANPRVADDLFAAFQEAKALYMEHLNDGQNFTAADKVATELSGIVGDPFPFGIEANRKTLEAMLQYSFDQGMIPQRMELERLFAPSLVKT